MKRGREARRDTFGVLDGALNEFEIKVVQLRAEAGCGPLVLKAPKADTTEE
jgi:hypothetical protein